VSLSACRPTLYKNEYELDSCLRGEREILDLCSLGKCSKDFASSAFNFNRSLRVFEKRRNSSLQWVDRNQEWCLSYGGSCCRSEGVSFYTYFECSCEIRG